MHEALNREIDELRLLMGSPRDPEGRVFAQLGDALRRAARIREAAQVLEEGLEAHPHYTPGHVALAWVQVERGDLEAARERFMRTLDLDPDNPFGLLGLGRILELQGDDSGAGMVRRALELHPGAEALAPSVPGEAEVLYRLPFRSLEQLAPAAGLNGEDDVFPPPFRHLDELAPDDEEPQDLSALPFMTLWELRPTDAPPAPAPPPEADAPVSLEVSRDEDPTSAPPPDVSPGEDAASLEALEVPTDDDATFLEAPAQQESPFPDALPKGDAVLPGAGDGEEDGVEPSQEDSVRPTGHEGSDVVDEPGEGEEDDDATPLTRTMAELLVRQGLLDRAAHLYRELEARNPHDEELSRRREEVEAMRDRLGGAPDAGDHTLPGAVEPSTLPPAGHPPTPAVDTGDVHPSLDVPEPDPDTPTPYAWEEDAEEVAESSAPGLTAGAYFGQLLAWAPATPDSEADEADDADPSRSPDADGT